MNATELLRILDSLEADTSRLFKAHILKTHMAEANFRKMLFQALNPFLVFHVLPKDTWHGTGESDEVPWHVLEALQTRQITGNDAKMAIERALQQCTPAAGEVFLRIMAKDLRCGVGAKTVNGVVPRMIPQFECQLADKFEEPLRWPQYMSPKLDGLRTLAIVEGDDVTFYSRNGLPFPSVQHLAPQLVLLAAGQDVVFDGECLAGGFLDSVSAIRTKGKPALDAVFHIFDRIPLSEFQRQGETVGFVHRWDLLQLNYEVFTARGGDTKAIRLVPHVEAHSLEEVMSYYEDLTRQGLEGVIVKKPDASYRYKRSRDWMKVKSGCFAPPTIDLDLPIIRAVEGLGKLKGSLGALVVDYNGKEVSVGSGTNGFLTDKKREELWEMRETLPGQMLQVIAMEKTPDGSLRHPRAVRLRWDKRPEDGPGC